MTAKEVVDRIRQLQIPRRAKAELLLLWTRAKRLVEGILKFIERHRQFAEAVLLGALIAFLLAQVPWIGGFLALCALVTATAVGVMKELREDIAKLFDPIMMATV
jgi:hypothetical protein